MAKRVSFSSQVEVREFVASNDGKRKRLCREDCEADSNRSQFSMERVENVDKAMQQLHSIGYVVMKAAFSLDAFVEECVYATNFKECVFNGVNDNMLTYDGNRLQGTGRWQRDVKELLQHFLKVNGFMKAVHARKTVQNLCAMRSLKGGSAQPLHMDSAKCSLKDTLEDADVPLSCIYALEDDTRLGVQPWTGCFKRILLNLKRGDLLIFRGDLPHYGTPYDSENTRIHAYVDSTLCKRRKGDTYVMNVGGVVGGVE